MHRYGAIVIGNPIVARQLSLNIFLAIVDKRWHIFILNIALMRSHLFRGFLQRENIFQRYFTCRIMCNWFYSTTNPDNFFRMSLSSPFRPTIPLPIGLSWSGRTFHAFSVWVTNGPMGFGHINFSAHSCRWAQCSNAIAQQLHLTPQRWYF